MQQVHLVVGKDEFLAERARQAVVAALREELGPAAHHLTVTRVAASELTEGEFLALLSPSLFSEDHVIIIYGVDDTSKATAEMILQAAKNPAPGVYLVVEHGGGGRNKALASKLAKLGTTHQAAPLKRHELPGWVHREFASHGRRVTPDVPQALIEGVGSNLRELASAVEQLSADSAGDITAATVRAYYSGQAEVSTFDIADWAVSGQVSKAVAATRRALQLGTSPVAIAAALAAKISLVARLYATTGRVNENALAGELGAHPFVIKKTLPVARRWGDAAVDQAVILMAELDASLKGQGGEPEYEIERAVLTIAQLAR